MHWFWQLQTIHGSPNGRVTSLVWCPGGVDGSRLFSSNVDGTVSRWDLFNLKQEVYHIMELSYLAMIEAPMWTFLRVSFLL